MELPKLRKKIDAIDREIAKLLDKRFKISLEIAAEKVRIGKDVKDSSREQEVLQNAASYVSEDLKGTVRDVFVEIMQKSIDLQHKVIEESKQ